MSQIFSFSYIASTPASPVAAIKVKYSAEEERIINSRLEEIDKHLKEIEEKEKKSADCQLTVIEENMKKEISHLDKVFSEKHDLWVNEIFSAVVNN